MPTLLAPDGVELDYVVKGEGAPVTVLAHGAGASVDETRPLGAGVPGTRAYLHFRGHGPSGSSDGWGYPWLAADLRAVADEMGATRALGVSMGAGALLHLLEQTPDRFERLVFFLPAAIDEKRAGEAVRRLLGLAELIDAGDVEKLEEQLRADMPLGARGWRGMDAYLRARAEAVAGSAVSAALRGLCVAAPIDDRATLARVTAPALVIGQEGDSVHPARVARELAAALPSAQLRVFDESGALWGGRRELRTLLAAFLGG